jgi:hypothetical protein
MLFLSILCMASGFTLVTAGVKGDALTTDAGPAWKAPWGLWVDAIKYRTKATPSPGFGGPTTGQAQGGSVAAPKGSTPFNPLPFGSGIINRVL